MNRPFNIVADEPHTSRTALCMCVCRLACRGHLLWISNEHVQKFYEGWVFLYTSAQSRVIVKAMAQIGVKVTFKFSGSALLSTRRSFFTWVPDDEDCLYSLQCRQWQTCTHYNVDSDKPCCYKQTMHIVCVSWQDMKPAVWCQLMLVPWSICMVLYYWSVYTLLLSSSDICASNWGQAAGRWGQDEVCTHWWRPSHPAECVPCLQTEWVHHILVPPYSSRIFFLRWNHLSCIYAGLFAGNILGPLNPEFFSLETSFSLYMHLTHRISIFVRALTPKLNPSPLPALTSRLVTLAMPTHYWACSIVITVDCQTPTQSPSVLSYQK